MAYRVHGLRVESRPVTVFAQGTVGDIEVTTTPIDCSAPPDPPCCGATYDTQLVVAAEGPLLADFGSFVGDWVLDWDGERQSWAGSVQSGAVQISTEVWCEEDPELGQVWWISGWYTPEDWESVPFFVTAENVSGVLLAEIEVSGTDHPITVVVAHPCEPGGSGGGGGGGPVSFCGCTNLPLTLYAHFSGALSAYGTVALAWNGGSYTNVTLPTNSCNSAAIGMSLLCVDSGTLTCNINSPGSFFGEGTAWDDDATVTTCSPFEITFTGTTTVTSGTGCPGSYTILVDENP